MQKEINKEDLPRSVKGIFSLSISFTEMKNNPDFEYEKIGDQPIFNTDEKEIYRYENGKFIKGITREQFEKYKVLSEDA